MRCDRSSKCCSVESSLDYAGTALLVGCSLTSVIVSVIVSWRGPPHQPPPL